MKHFGDITKISGLTAPIVDTVIFGAPCQDLSVAGKRAGMKHSDLGDEETTRSGLFMEAVRIIKEMREQDVHNGRSGHDIRPRYGIYENVPGAFSSNKGEDFRIVLEELAKVADKDAVIPMPQSGKWTTSGCIVGDGWSIAWRVLDAQFWGVPQRRRRIALVADFGGESAPEILFVRKSLSGHTEPSKQKRKETSPDASRGFGADDREGITFEPGIASREGGHIYEGVSGTLRAKAGDNQMAVAYTMQDREGKAGGGKGALIAEEKSATLRANNMQYLFQPVYSVENHPADSRVDIDESGKVQTLTSRMGTGGGNVPMVMALDRASFNQGKNAKYDFEISDDGINSPIVAKGPSAVCYGIGSYDSNAWKSNNPHSGVYEADTARTLDSINCGYPACNQGGTAVVQGFPEVRDGVVGTLDANYYKGCGTREGMERSIVAMPYKTRYIVRRLTPLECERLQGFPDGWTDIGEYIDTNGKKKQSSDAARYKALGNSIALPPWKWVLKRLCACYERDATMASLFDGIGGFPRIWEQINGKGTCLWASEIEDFPIAVTKKRIGDDING
jgi:DNA (cytosine-5)-methyltransferase 1